MNTVKLLWFAVYQIWTLLSSYSLLYNKTNERVKLFELESNELYF